ncbi:MAG: magnesium transporter [Gammaproteobacteria bacterium]|nr:magnesium transporter [Gammaproteobacteria bacterium]
MTEQLTDIVANLTTGENKTKEAVFVEAIDNLESSELSLLLESLPIAERWERWQQVAQDSQIAVLVHMRSDARQSILEQFSDESLHDLLKDAHADDLIELADTLPDSVVDAVLESMDDRQKQYYDQVTQYGNDQIGHYLDRSFKMFPETARVQDALRAIRKGIAPYTNHIYLVKRGVLTGIVDIDQLYQAESSVVLKSLMLDNLVSIQAGSDLLNATEKMEHCGFSSLPVVDDNNFLIGRLTLRTALELTRMNYESKLMATAGLNENEDLFAPVMRSSKRRATWLGINLLTAFLASWTIGLFEATLEKVVALAVLMPIVASMGGIAGSQTLTLIIRGIATGHISSGNIRNLLSKELGVGVINGILWALVIGLAAGLWFQSQMIGIVIASAIAINILAAALAGVLIPILLNRFKIDPALSGSVILTTVTDVVGFVTFLGLGTYLLL